MSSANSFHIDFPSKPTLIVREEGKVTFINEKGEAAAICLSTQGMAPLEAAVLYQRRGLDDIRMFSGPMEKVAAAFHDFEIRAIASSASPVKAGMPVSLRPSHWLMAGAVTTIAILAIGAAGYLTANKSVDPQTTSRIEMLEKLAKQLEQLSGDPNRPAPGSSAGLPTLMPPGGPLNFKPAKVKQSGGADATTSAAPAPAPTVPGAMPVPKELPSLPQAAASTTIDVAALTDAEPTKASNSKAKVAVAVDAGPAMLIEPASSSVTPQTQADAPENNADGIASNGDKPADGKAEDKISAPGVAPMSPAEAQELLKTLEQIKTQAAEGGELTPELLKQLPMDVARRLVSTGIATVTPQERSERAQRMARIVRLPANIINKYRGRDGIASIPEQDTWVANGGRITIPLPGGGDIQEPGTLKEFGLQP